MEESNLLLKICNQSVNHLLHNLSIPTYLLEGRHRKKNFFFLEYKQLAEKKNTFPLFLIKFSILILNLFFYKYGLS